MNQDSHDHEIGAALEREVSGLHDSPFTLADVQGRARGIRRRRHALAAGVAAAAVAVAVPSVLLLGSTDDRTGGLDPAAPTSSASEAVDATAQGASVLRDGTVTRPDGSTVDLAIGDDQVLSFGVLSDGRFVLTTNGRQVVQVLSADGEPEATYPAELNAFEVGATGDRVAWIDDDRRVQVLESGAREPIGMQDLPAVRYQSWTVDAVLGEQCAVSGSSCRVLVSHGYDATTEVTLDGVRDLETTETFRVSDVSVDGETWAVAFPPGENQQFGCSGLYDVASGMVTARTCDTSGLRFAPDGQHLEGSRGDNNMAGEVTVLDRDLAPVLTYSPGPQVVSRSGWADPETLLVSISDVEGRWSLVRVPIDGSAPTTVVGPVQGGNPEIETEFLPSM